MSFSYSSGFWFHFFGFFRIILWHNSVRYQSSVKGLAILYDMLRIWQACDTCSETNQRSRHNPHNQCYQLNLSKKNIAQKLSFKSGQCNNWHFIWHSWDKFPCTKTLYFNQRCTQPMFHKKIYLLASSSISPRYKPIYSMIMCKIPLPSSNMSKISTKHGTLPMPKMQHNPCFIRKFTCLQALQSAQDTNPFILWSCVKSP
jgi:hypothetical protein